MTRPSEFSTDQWHAAVARLAYGIWEIRGRLPGSQIQDWLEAEELLIKFAPVMKRYADSLKAAA